MEKLKAVNEVCVKGRGDEDNLRHSPAVNSMWRQQILLGRERIA